MKEIKPLQYLKVFRYVASNLLQNSGKYPLYASLKITRKCPLQCRYCDMPKEDSVQPDLSADQIENILVNLASSSIFVLTIEGGEPFLHPEIDRILAFASRQTYYLAVVTSVRGFDLDRIRENQQSIDFLHLSIDEAHGNLDLLKNLEKFRREWSRPALAIQSVVGRAELDAMEEKVKVVRAAGIRICLMPAASLLPGKDCYPDPADFRSRVEKLRERYPGTVLTSASFLRAINSDHSCSSSSIIIDPGGDLFYPCRMLQQKPVNLLNTSLQDFVKSPAAKILRQQMDLCSRSCGWYQYFAVSFRSIRNLSQDLQGSLERTHNP